MENPIQEIKISDFCFCEAEINLPSWAGFQSRRGPYGSQDKESPSDGTVLIGGEPPQGEQDLAPEQLEAVRYLISNDALVNRAIIDSILKEYPEIYETYAECLADCGETMPKHMTAELLAEHIGIANIHLQPVSKDGVAYVGFELGCSWDDSHGLGLMLHKDVVVDIGGADTAIHAWIAERHKGVETPPRDPHYEEG